MKDLKIIISGLNNAGKTSILTAFDKRYDFENEIIEIEPTKKVKYHHTEFLNNSIHFWDMGGQEQYRKFYVANEDKYFASTDLLIYVIDIQDDERFESSHEYLINILQYFEKNNMNVPLIVAFHKFDPNLKDDPKLIENVRNLTREVFKIGELAMLYVQTSIYDIISIVHLLSAALSMVDGKHLELEELFKKYLKNFDSKSLILFDQNGVIISESYIKSMEFDLYLKIMKSLKEHLILLKKIQEEQYYNFNLISNHLLSYLHWIKLKDKTFYISVVIKEKAKDTLLGKFPDFLIDLNSVLEPILSKISLNY